jgi:sec-independent protein translocase protein TatC
MPRRPVPAVVSDKIPDNSADEEQLAEGTLLSHLIELRSRLVKIAAAVMGVFVCLLPFSRRIYEFAAQPMVAALPGGKMVAIDPASSVFAPFKLTFIVALMVAMPVVLYQVWAFVAPGLYRKEKRFAFPLLFSSIVLFYAGVAFAYFVVFPLMFNFFVSFTPDSVEMATDISSYLSFVTTISLAFGVTFEVPVATVLLVFTGLVSVEKVAKARPYVFLMAFVVGMFLTPPDVFSQTLLAVPVYLLYELGIVMAKVFAPAREDKEEAVVSDG